MEYLILSEISKKQDYIFKSNKLKENIGASLIIKHLTEEFPNQFLEKNDGIKIFEGGGKSLYKFTAKESALNFIKQLTKETFVQFPGVEMFLVIQEFNMELDDIIEKIDEAYKKLAIKKNERIHSPRQLSFGIQKVCRSTQLPASTYAQDGQPISTEIKRKNDFSKDDQHYFNRLFPEGYRYRKEFDELIMGDEKSFISVIHIDGNLMGKKINTFKALQKQQRNNVSVKEFNERYLRNLGDLSRRIAEAYENTFKEMCMVLEKNKPLLKEHLQIDEDFLPIRPLIVAGDDISFVVNGKIGIECAKIFLEKLNNKELEIDSNTKMKMNACAGVAIVKAHYPFSRAYRLAEELCQSAKSTILKDFEGEDYSVIDWHISHADISGSLDTIRKFYYQMNDIQLNMRPLYINNKKTWRTYDNFVYSMNRITSVDIPRNKIKELREVFREGKERSQMYITVNKLESVVYRFPDVNASFGFSDDNKCLYYDAIEAMDLFLKLEEGI